MKRLFFAAVAVLIFAFPAGAQGPLGELVPALCPMPIPGMAVVECGYVTVPERHENPGGATMDLAVAILRAENPDSRADPVLYLEGGPGGSALYSLDGWVGTPLVRDRDLILFDQRGTGYSWPALLCEYYEEGFDFDPDDVDFVEYETACAAAITAEGIDLGAYNSAQSAQDVKMIVQALGYEQVNLYGISYGTRLALTIMRDVPEIARAVVLDSPYPVHIDGYEMQGINGYNAIDSLLNTCAADAACNTAFPDLRARFYTWVESGDEVRGDLGDGVEDIDGYVLVNVLFDVLYDTEAIPLVPKALYDVVENGDGYLFGDLVSGAYSDDPNADMRADMFVEMADLEAMREAGIDDYDAFIEFFGTQYDDELYDLYSAAFESADEYDYDDLVHVFLGFETIEETNAYLDGLSEEQLDLLFNNMVSFAALGWSDVSDADGVFNSVTCIEELPFNDLAQTDLLTEALAETMRESLNQSVFDQAESCGIWGVAPAAPLENEIVRSDVPSLVLAGQFDPITPPNFAEAAMEGLTNGQLVVVGGAGHSLIDSGTCPVGIVIAFLDNPGSPVDAACAASVQIEWVTE